MKENLKKAAFNCVQTVSEGVCAGVLLVMLTKYLRRISND